MAGRGVKELAVALSLGLALVSGCGGGGGWNGGRVACTAYVAPALEVSVYDAATGLPAAVGATVTAQDGAFLETLAVSGWTGVEPETAYLHSGAAERAGTYTVRVEKAGYRSVEWRNVRVTADECHVRTVRLEARLQPQP